MTIFDTVREAEAAADALTDVIAQIDITADKALAAGGSAQLVSGLHLARFNLVCARQNARGQSRILAEIDAAQYVEEVADAA